MPVANPEYNPDWKDILHYHRDEAERWGVIVSEGYKNSDISPAFEEAYLKQQEHSSATLDCFRMQFPTVQEHAQWVFDSFQPDVIYGARVLVNIPDFEKFVSLDDVDKAYRDVRNEAERVYAERHYSLPVQDIPDSDAFKSGQESRVISYRRHFQESEIYPNGFGQGANISTLITAHQVGHEAHVCFMYDHEHKGMSVINGVELMAGVMYREAVQSSKMQERDEHKGLLSRFLKGATGKTNIPKPEDFHFYIHVPPMDGGFRKEAFMEVVLEFSDGKFSNPRYLHKKFVPEIVKSAQTRLMMEIAPPLTIELKRT